LDDTTAENGATEVLPGSHLWPDDKVSGSLTGSDFANKTLGSLEHDPGEHPEAVKAVMPAGSLMVAKGTLWHRGGANKSKASRLIVTPQYCPGWARPLENIMAAVPRGVAAAFPQRIRELIGYSIHPPFMGYVDGVHPDKLLTRYDETAVVDNV
jgi:ectoine hydroxylase-related dioxygenase (phytanoyl-CoA dioxygenase family)